MAKPVYVASQKRAVLGVHREAGEVVPGVADLPSRVIERLLEQGLIELDEKATARALAVETHQPTDVIDGGRITDL